MAYDPGALEAALAAAVGEDSSLIAELRGAFFASADAHVMSLDAATTRADWIAAAKRLKGLAASFGALRVMDAAEAAMRAERGDAKAMQRIARSLAALADAPTG